MITKDKTSSIISTLFLGVIALLVLNVVTNFEIIDILYLIFIISCYIRYIYIKTH
ncbi:MAG: hypothetical protein IJ093_02470 [Bacilli bacterium]|nr:hypothetical protein [Bacilli bacterium]